jgi:hypothetical protein
MQYKYQLKTDSINHSIIISTLRNRNTTAYNILDYDGSPMSTDVYWAMSISDIQEFSKEFPLVLFTLHEWYDVEHFVTYIKDGKWQEASVHEVISPFNESKLR